MQCNLRAQRSHTFNWGFLPCTTFTAISLDSLNIFTKWCMLVGERPKFFAILHWEMWFLICLTILSWNLAQGYEPRSWDAPFTVNPIMIPWPITNSPAYCGLSQNSLTWIFYKLFTFIMPLSKLLWSVLQPSQIVYIYKIHLDWSVFFLQSHVTGVTPQHLFHNFSDICHVVGKM